MQGKKRSRRGTGHLYQKDDRWYGQWYVRGNRVKRSLGPVRQPGTTDGLTQRQAQARMLEAMAATDSAPAPVTERLTVEEAGKRRIRELARRGRKQDTTLANYESEIRCHFAPHFAERPITEIGEDDVADFIDACLNDLSVKTVRNLYTHYAPAPNEVDLVNDAFDPQALVEGANEGAKPSETQPHSDR